MITMASGRAPVTVVVLTYNEERNLGPCLDSVKNWASRVIIVDSGSHSGVDSVVLAIASRR